MKNVIFTQRVEIIENYQERRDCSDQRISNFINESGFLPIPIPNNYHLAKDLINNLKPAGIVLAGGNSLSAYGGNAPERDAMDEIVIQIAIQKHIPIYGFCRGMQSILSFFGNDLINVKGHAAVRHLVNGTEGVFETNSYHNQACVKLNNNNLKIMMCSEDGVIEMICHRELPIIGTMWHPEREKNFRQRDILRIQKLFNV